MDLEALREKLNGVDDEILRLFLKRMEVAGQVADYKKAHHLPIYQPQREQEILESVSERAGELGCYARSLFSTLMELSRQHQADRGGTP